ncbi:MAG: hypothetical protein JST04_12190 [Bdellovibrionales bacterium]|nr:hypothetical protein [Bdellovibrionales bacterium]
MVRRSVFFTLIFGFALSASAFAGKRVLVVGDSHSTGQFKDGLLKMLMPTTKTGLSTEMVGSCGSRARDWLSGKHATTCGYFEKDYGETKLRPNVTNHSTPTLESLVNAGNPDYVVIALGTNQLGDNSKESERSVRNLIAKATAKGAKCMWVGPPEVGPQAIGAKNLKAFYDMLDRVEHDTGCKKIDSRAPRTNNKYVDKKYHVHYENQKGIDWGTATGNEILQKIQYWPKGNETAKGGSGGGTPYSPQNSSTSQGSAI